MARTFKDQNKVFNKHGDCRPNYTGANQTKFVSYWGHEHYESVKNARKSSFISF